MKKIMLTLLLYGSMVTLMAQNTLQFNQVININLTGSTPAVSGSYTLQTYSATVPAGKVWKIESSSCRLEYSPISGYLYGNSSNNTISVLIDNVPISNISPSSYNVNFRQQPVWLAAGSHTFVLKTHIVSGDIMTGYGQVTAIEFNVVP